MTILLGVIGTIGRLPVRHGYQRGAWENGVKASWTQQKPPDYHRLSFRREAGIQGLKSNGR